MKIDKHILYGIEAADRGENENALLHACIAIDGTSQKDKNTDKSSRNTYI
jgi:hypothetical protein